VHAETKKLKVGVWGEFFVLQFVTTVNIVTPYISRYGYPNNVPGGQKSV
jgi:hypothetical protein